MRQAANRLLLAAFTFAAQLVFADKIYSRIQIQSDLVRQEYATGNCNPAEN